MGDGDDAAGGSGSGRLRQCLIAAEAGSDVWHQFCNSLGEDELLAVAGNHPVRRACHSKGLESELSKKNWCRNQFED